jgi:hypothetical protein
MNSQLPEYDWKRKLYSYSSQVDKRLLKKILDAKSKKGDQPLSFWLFLAVLLFFISGSILLTDQRNTAHIDTIKFVPNPGKARQQPTQPDRQQNHSLSEKPYYSKTGRVSKNNKGSLIAIPHDSDGTLDPGDALAKNQQAGVNETGGQPAVDNPYSQYSEGMFANEPWKKKQYTSAMREGWNSFPVSFSLPPLFSYQEDRIGLPETALKNNTVVIPECPEFGNGRNDWYLEVFGALDFPHKKLQATSGKSDFVERKDSSEKFTLSYSAGFRISKNISPSWLIKSGVHFSQFNENFLYRNEHERRITTVITIRTIVRAPGDTLFIADSSQVEVVGVRTKTTHNRYRNIDIPLLLSYEVRNPGLTLAVQLGTIFNLRSSFHGDMLDTTGFPLSQSGKDPASQFNNSLGFGIYAGASMIKSVGTDLDVFAEPYYRRYLNNQASADAPFEQYLSNWGVQFGIRYKLNRGGQRY